MNLLKIILDFVAAIAWPATVLCIFFAFKKYLIALFPYITRLKAGSVEVSIEQQVAGLVDEQLELRNVSNDIEENLRPIIYQENNVVQPPVTPEESSNDVMLAFTANRSFDSNMKYNIYYDPANRKNNTAFEFVGLYKDNAIRAVGRVSKIVYCDYHDGKLIGSYNYNIDSLTQTEYNRIKEIIETTDYYNIRLGCKFILVDEFYKTNYRKASKYPIRAKKYFWLNRIKGYHTRLNTEGLASLLNNATWE